jgi:hypothetical protein
MWGVITPASNSGLLSVFYTYNSLFACILHFSECSLSIVVLLCELSENKNLTRTYNSFHCLEIIDCGIGSSKKFSLKSLPVLCCQSRKCNKNQNLPLQCVQSFHFSQDLRNMSFQLISVQNSRIIIKVIKLFRNELIHILKGVQNLQLL